MLINNAEIKGGGFFAQCVLNRDSDHEAAVTIVEQYLDNPRAVLQIFGHVNVIRCHVYYLNWKYNLTSPTGQ